MSDNDIDDFIVSCLLVDEEEKRKKRRLKRFWVHSIHNKINDRGEFYNLFPDLMEDVKFFQYFIHCIWSFILSDTLETKMRTFAACVISFTSQNSPMTSSSRAARSEKVALPRIRAAFSSSRFVRCGLVNVAVLKLMLRSLYFISYGSCGTCGAEQ